VGSWVVVFDLPGTAWHNVRRLAPKLGTVVEEAHWIKYSDIMYTIRNFNPRPAADTALAKARQVFSKHGGMLRTSKAMRLGIHPRTLYTLRDAGDIEQIGRGLYRLSTAPPLSSPDLVPIAKPTSRESSISRQAAGQNPGYLVTIGRRVSDRSQYETASCSPPKPRR